MQRTLTIVSLALVGVFAAAMPAGAETVKGNLTVVVTGMKKTGGKVYIGLINSKATFLTKNQRRMFRGVARPIKNKRVVHVFRNIPAAYYALQVYHDENGNGKMDTNFVGLPTEPVGFSNKARIRFGPPAYKDARFRFKGGKASHRVRLR